MEDVHLAAQLPATDLRSAHLPSALDRRSGQHRPVTGDLDLAGASVRAPERQAAALSLALLLSAAALSGCSGEDDHPLGETVEVEFHDDQSNPAGSGTVTVTAVRKGSTTELEDAGFTLDANQMSAAAYFVDAVFKSTGDGTLTPNSPGGEDPDGKLIPALTVIDLEHGADRFEPCPGIPEEVAAGQEVEGCSIVLVPEGTEMARIYFHPGGSEDFVYWKIE